MVITLIAVCAFLLVTSVALIWANGLSFNSATGAFDQTSVVAIETRLQNVKVRLNGQEKGVKTPLQIRQLKAGSYELEIEKEGYVTYRHSFQLSAGQAGIADNVVLIAKNPLVTTLDPETRFIDSGTLSNGLLLDGGELYDGTTFITRFSSDPVQVHRMRSSYLYQVGKEFRLYFPENKQEYLVYTAASEELVPVNLAPFSWAFSVNENGSKKLINVTIPTEVEASTQE